jgi:hypothetical protein
MQVAHREQNSVAERLGEAPVPQSLLTHNIHHRSDRHHNGAMNTVMSPDSANHVGDVSGAEGSAGKLVI